MDRNTKSRRISYLRNCDKILKVFKFLKKGHLETIKNKSNTAEIIVTYEMPNL